MTMPFKPYAHDELMAAGGEYREIYESQNAASESEVA